MNRPKYKVKYYKAMNLVFTFSLIAFSAVWAAYIFYQTARRTKDYARSLEESQNVMVWIMDSSCAEQIDSGDGVIRLKIK